MGKIVAIEEKSLHVVEECMCVKCLRRWIDVRPASVWLKDCVCPGCRERGYVIATGQDLDDDDDSLG